MPLSRRKILQYGGVGIASIFLPPMANAATADPLQHQVNQLVQRQRRTGLISSNERTAWSVYDFRQKKKLVAINEDRPLQAASMVKVFIALAYFYLHQTSPSRYPYGAGQRWLMQQMLVKSSNKATNNIMRKCGGPRKVQQLAQLASSHRFKQLSIVEYIPAGGRTYRNKASAHDYSRFLYALWHNRLPGAREMRRIMAIKNGNRIEVPRMMKNVNVYDKTGSTGRLCGDMGIVQLRHNHDAYTFVGIIEKSRKSKYYGRWIRNRGEAMRQVSGLVYDYMIKR